MCVYCQARRDAAEAAAAAIREAQAELLGGAVSGGRAEAAHLAGLHLRRALDALAPAMRTRARSRAEAAARRRALHEMLKQEEANAARKTKPVSADDERSGGARGAA